MTSAPAGLVEGPVTKSTGGEKLDNKCKNYFKEF